MNNNLIFVPVLVQLGLTLWLYIYLGKAKSNAAKLGQVDESRRALHDDAWPDNVLQINNCIRNQFEVPVLFYVLVGVLWATGGVSVYTLVAAWGFVLSRIVHAVVHTGSNVVPIRRKVFMLGCFILIGMLGYAAFLVTL